MVLVNFKKFKKSKMFIGVMRIFSSFFCCLTVHLCRTHITMIDGKSHSMYHNRHDYLLSTEVYISMLLSKQLVGDIDMVSDDF